MDDHGNSNNHASYLECNGNIAFLDLPELFNAFGQFVEDIQGDVNCTYCKNNTENKLDERNSDGSDAINRKEAKAQGLVDTD